MALVVLLARALAHSLQHHVGMGPRRLVDGPGGVAQGLVERRHTLENLFTQGVKTQWQSPQPAHAPGHVTHCCQAEHPTFIGWVL